MFENAVVALIALFTLGLPATPQEPTRQERAATLVSARSWGESEVAEYIRLVSTEDGRSVLLPVTSSGAECERQVAALDSYRRRLQANPQMGETMTEDRFAAMRGQAVQAGACSGVVAQIDRLIVVRRTLAATSTAIAVEPTNRSRAESLISDASWSESDVTEYIYLVTTRTGRAVLLPATTQGDECERQVAALDNLRLRLQARPEIIESLTEERLSDMREDALEVSACRGVVAQIDRLGGVRRTLADTSTGIAVAPASEAPETSDRAVEDDRYPVYLPTELRPGQPVFDIEMRPDCSVYYRGALIHGPTPEQTRGNCVSAPRVSRSPSGRRTAVFTQFHEYGREHTVDRVSIVNSLDESVSMRAREIQQGKMLLATNVWSTDEFVVFMSENTYFGPDINLLQFDVSLPCTFNISRSALACANEVPFGEALTASALRASPLARCVANRTCFVHFGISNARPEGDGFAFTGIVQMRSADTEHFSETFVPGEDIVWFAVSGRVNGNALLQDMTLRVVDPLAEQDLARVQPEAPAPAPASEPPETSTEENEDGSLAGEEVDVLRPGQPLFDVELRADCSVYYRRTLVQRRTEGEYGEDGNCELLPTVHRSPSRRWIALHTPIDNYGFGRIAIVDTVADRVVVQSREFVRNGRLFPLNVWSPDENRLLLTDLSFHGPPINEGYQSTVMVLCELDISAAALGCTDSGRFASALQAAALRASPLARCLPQRSCYLVMDISEPRFEAGELLYTGTVQLKTLEAGSARPSGPVVSETFVPGEDIAWFQFSGRGPRSTAQDITLRVLDPAAR